MTPPPTGAAPGATGRPSAPRNAAPTRVHGGADAEGAARWDFSTCSNAAGPCPAALAAVRAADPTRYPDPAATAVREALAALHGVDVRRILPAASASEFIQRVTAIGGRLAAGAVAVPRYAYGDYAAAAAAWGRPVQWHSADADADADADAKARSEPDTDTDADPAASRCSLRWYAEPSSPFGADMPSPPAPGAVPTVLDAVYAPLRLRGSPHWDAAARDAVFVLHSPNKALGLTGLRGAYAVTPRADAVDWDLAAWCDALAAAAPSWPLSAHADAMLRAWATPAVQRWVAASRETLAAWHAALAEGLLGRGFAWRDGVAPFATVRPPRPIDLRTLRRQGVAVRDATSFGLPGWWRVSAQPPEARQALFAALDRAPA